MISSNLPKMHFRSRRGGARAQERAGAARDDVPRGLAEPFEDAARDAEPLEHHAHLERPHNEHRGS